MRSNHMLFIRNQSFLLIVLILLTISACGTSDSTVTTHPGNKKGGISIPSVLMTALPDNGTLSAYIRVDDGSRQQMSIEGEFASVTLTGLTPGEHTFTVEFDFVLFSNPNQALQLASATKVFELNTGENILAISESEFNTEQFDEDGDGQSNLTELNNDTNPFATIIVSTISGNSAEDGTSATFTVVLTSEPTADVNFAISSSDTSEGTVDQGLLTFNSNNWDTPQTITVVGVDDDIADGDIDYAIIIAAADSSDTDYNGIDPDDVSISNIDDDVTRVSFTAATQSVIESVGTVTLNLALNQISALDVSVTFSVSGTASGGGIDHNLENGTINIPAGETAGTTSFTIQEDAQVEPDETVIVTLSNPTNAALGVQSIHTVTITNNDYSIGGTVIGYTGTGLILQNNGADDLPVSGSAFTFSSAIANGSSYNVTVGNQPVGQNCIVENSTGIVNNANINDIVVRCINQVAAYYTAAPSWNDYIADDGSDIFHAQGQACATPASCFHAGILRKVPLSGISSCNEGNFTASDDLSAFRWQCVDAAGGASMVSVELNPGIRLFDLIDTQGQAQWKNNAVTVSNDAKVIGKTPVSNDWWGNSIELNTSDTGLNLSGTIYVFNLNTFQSRSIGAEKVSVVIDPNVTMHATNTSAATLSASGQNYLWLEGNFDGVGANNGIHLTNVYSSMLRYVQVTAASQIPESAGLLLSSSHNNMIVDSNFIKNRWSGIQLNLSNGNTLINNEIDGHDSIYGNPPAVPSGPGAGLWLRTSNDNRVNGLNVNKHKGGIAVVTSSRRNIFTNVNLSNNQSEGVYVFSSQENVFDQVTTSNNDSYGIYFLQSQYNIISRFTNNNSRTYGARFSSSNNNIFSYGTLTNSLGYGFSFEDSSQNLLFGIAIVNNNYSGIKFLNSSNNTVGNLIIANNGSTAFPAGVNLHNSNNNYFTGIYKSGGNVAGDCFLSTDPVMINPGLNTDCTPNGTSDFGAIVPINFTDSTFVGKLTIVDQANATIQQGGAALYSNITDWNHFSNQYRGWGLDGGVFPNLNQQGRCRDTTVEPCRIWDWTLKLTDTIARKTLAEPDPLQVVQHPWVSNSSVTFLRNAVELSNDNRGNDNALCEPNNDEVCIAAYNIASDQGGGNLVNITTAAMTAAGITMYAYEN